MLFLFVLEYTKKYPQYVNNLILTAASPIAGPRLYSEANRYFEESVDPKRKQIFEKNMNDKDTDFISRMLKFEPMLWFNPDFDATDLWTDVFVNPVGAEKIWNDMFWDYEIPDISALDIPVLLLLGRYDYFNPPHLWDFHRHKFKNLTVRIFEKSGHTPSFEQPDLFYRECQSWFEKTNDL